MSEEWLAVVGYEGAYEVSSHGAVRRVAPAQGTRTGRVLARFLDRYGYAIYNLQANGKRARRKAHHLVAEAFIGPRGGLLIRHLDGNRANNTVVNLAWGTPLENTADRIRHGRKSGPRRVTPPT